MSEVPKFAVLFAPGTNCEQETMDAVEFVGGEAVLVHINELSRGRTISDSQGLIIPGGFSHGDNLGSGNVVSQRMQHQFGDQVRDMVEQGKPVLGICNGFQVLVRSGLLPNGVLGDQTATLTTNDSNRFEHRWTRLLVEPGNTAGWLSGDIGPVIELPVANKEGKYVASERELDRIEDADQVVFRYLDEAGEPTMKHPYNPNGSSRAIAGICHDLILGLMPHPERFLVPKQYKNWHRMEVAGEEVVPFGKLIFESLVNFVKAS